MKVSVSLPEDDLAFVDDYASRTGAPSRSSVLHRAISLLRMAELEEAYEEAWREWEDSADAQDWEATTGDGIGDAPR